MKRIEMKYYQVKSKTNKNNISPLRLKEILERLIAGYDMKTVSNIVGFKSRSIYNLFDRITIETKRGYAKYQKNVNCVVWT